MVKKQPGRTELKAGSSWPSGAWPQKKGCVFLKTLREKKTGKKKKWTRKHGEMVAAKWKRVGKKLQSRKKMKAIFSLLKKKKIPTRASPRPPINRNRGVYRAQGITGLGRLRTLHRGMARDASVSNKTVLKTE